ncbi:TPA: hypothetical protein ACH3X1_007157 [Trebouxia sp. C0004]
MTDPEQPQLISVAVMLVIWLAETQDAQGTERTLQRHFKNKAVFRDVSAWDFPRSVFGIGPEATQHAWAQHSGHAGYAPILTQYPSFAIPQVSASTWSSGGAATFSQPPAFSYLNWSSPSYHYKSMPSPPLRQHAPTKAYHCALAAASQPHPSPLWHSSPSTPQKARAAATGHLRATSLIQPPASAPGCPPAVTLRQLPATAPEQVPTKGPLHPNGTSSELPYVSASQPLPAQSQLVQKSASAASPHLPPALGTIDLGQHAQTHMQAQLAQQQAVQTKTQMPINLGQYAQTHMQAQLAQQQASTQMPDAAAVLQAVDASEAASVAALEADQDAGQPQLPAQPADSAPFKRFSIVKPVSSAAATREPIGAFQPPLPPGFPPALAAMPGQGDAATGAAALVGPQAGQPQQLCDRSLVPKLQAAAVTLARQTSHAGSAEPMLQTPAPVSNQLNAQPDIPCPALTSTREAPEQLSQPAMLASIQHQDDKTSSERFATEQPAAAPAQELAQLLFLKRRELSQKPLQKLPQAHQQLQGPCQEQPQGLFQAQPPEHLLTQPLGQLHLSSQAQCKVGRTQTAADAAGLSDPATPASAVAGRQGSLKAEADAELLHSNSSQSAVQLSPLNIGASPSDPNITQLPGHKGCRSAASAGSRGRGRSCRSYKNSNRGRSRSSTSCTTSRSSSGRSTSSDRSTLS